MMTRYRDHLGRMFGLPRTHSTRGGLPRTPPRRLAPHQHPAPTRVIVRLRYIYSCPEVAQVCIQHRPNFSRQYRPCGHCSIACGGHLRMRLSLPALLWTMWGGPLTTSEMARLQGVDLERFQDAGLTHQQMGRLIGNAMSVPVVARLLQSMLPAVGLTHAWLVAAPPLPAAACPAPAVAACPT